MRQINELGMTKNQIQGLNELKQKLLKHFPVESLILYGSYACGEADSESDIDLLILTKETLSRIDRHKITDTIFEINLQYDTNFSGLVIDQFSWERGLISILPFHDEILKQGIKL